MREAAVQWQVDHRIDLGILQPLRVEQVVNRAVAGEVDARVTHARRRRGQEAVEGVRRRPRTHGEDPIDLLVVGERLDQSRRSCVERLSCDRAPNRIARPRHNSEPALGAGKKIAL